METLNTTKKEKKAADITTLSAVAKKAAEKEAQKKRDSERKTKTKEKNFLYKFQLEEKLTDKESKKKRNKLRRDLNNIQNLIILNEKKENEENIKSFLSFYKKNYLLNDFTKESISNSSDETKSEDLQRMLNIVKKYLEKK